ncbi:MAG: SusC/RagA family TonB-linked outer membrane protein [Ginsengibacter sp.]
MKNHFLQHLAILFIAFVGFFFLDPPGSRAGIGGWQSSSIIVKGNVTDATGEPLAGVSIIEKGTNNGTTTDAKGNYSISVQADATLVFTSLGMASQEIKVNGRSRINVEMTNTEVQLNEVVVGYSVQKTRNVTASVSKLNPREMNNVSNPNPIQAVQGKIAGLSVPVVSGQPGIGASNIIIRGGTKLNVYGSSNGNSGGVPTGGVNASSPLVVIDGVFRSLDDINPEDIQSFEVMKDAASTAIYGARGANGVIVITTKSGKFNSKPVFTANYRHTWETPSRSYHYLNAKDYLTLARTTVQNTADLLPKDNLLNHGGFSAGTTVYTEPGQYGNAINLTALYDNIVDVEGQDYVNNLLTKGWQVMDDPINPGTKLLFKDNHYQDLLWNTGNTDNYNVGVNGGGEHANYNVSLGYVDQAGTFVGTHYKRYNALGNFGFKVSDNFKLTAMVNYDNELPNYVEQYQNELTRGTRLTPLIRIFKDNGDPTTGEVLSARNRFHTLKYDHTTVSTERLVSRLAGDLTITRGLHWRPDVSYLISDYSHMFHRDAFPDPIQFSTQREKRENTDTYRQLMVDQILQYDFTLKEDHHFSVLGGFNYTRELHNYINIGSQRATNDYITSIDEPSVTTINGQTVTNVVAFGTSIDETRSASYFGQLNYNFKGKYLFSGALRDDGFSNFAPQNKYALFPSVSAGWNVNDENFWKVKLINSLKVRASWGTAGSNDLSVTDTYGNYRATAYAQNPGILRTNLSNPALKWEATETTDAGFDAGFLNSRITLTVDWYNKLTKNRIASKPLPSEAPFSSITYNNGVLQNKGIEIALGGNPIETKNFTWNANFTFAYNHQMIVSLPDNGRDKNRQGGTVVYDPATKSEHEVGGYAEGERPFGIWGYKVVKVFSTDEEAAAWNAKVKDQLASPLGIQVGKHAGDFEFADLNGDGVIDTKDEVFFGYRSPDIIGGMQNTFTYKNFSLRFNVDYATGFVIENGALARSLGQGRAFNEGAPSEALGNDIWQKPGDVGKKYARFSFADYDYGQRNYLRKSPIGTNNGYGSDVSAMVTKGNFLAIREIYLSYDLSKNWLRKIHANGLNIYASVYNVGYITAYKGLNPETYTGFDDGGYPRPRQFTLGANLKF